MTHSKRTAIKRITAMLLTVIMLLTTVAPSLAVEPEKTIEFATINGLSYVSKENRGEYNSVFLSDAKAKDLHYENIDSIMDSSFEAIKQKAEKGLKYVIVSGDMTYSGEYKNHEELSQRLIDLEKNTGVNVIVLPSKTDINNPNSSTLANGKREYIAPTTAYQFRTLSLLRDGGRDEMLK